MIEGFRVYYVTWLNVVVRVHGRVVMLRKLHGVCLSFANKVNEVGSIHGIPG
jgi:hypothetical protein